MLSGLRELGASITTRPQILGQKSNLALERPVVGFGGIIFQNRVCFQDS